MKVKLLNGLSGPKGTWNPGDEYPCDAAEGARLIEAGYAEAIGGKVEKAEKPATRAKRGN